MRERVLNDIIAAMKGQNKEVLAVLRMVKGAMQLEEINKKKELDDEEMTAVFAKQIKTRKESIEEFKKGNRVDLVEQTESEIAILEKYLPEQLSEEKVLEVIEEAIATIKPSSASDMGKVMGAVTPLLRGKCDMGLVSKLVKEKLSNL